MCDGTNFHDELIVPDWLLSKEPFSVKECTNCSFRFTANPPSAESAGAYYETEDYIEHSDNAKGLINKLYHMARRQMLKYKLRLVAKHAEGKKLLDIGSGSGYFLNTMKTAGYDVNGVEISDKAVELCQSNFGIKAYSPDDFLADKIPGKIDVASMWHVFEHVYSYEEYFKLIHEKLNDAGTSFVAMPNHLCLDETIYGKYWAAYDTPRHLWHFTPITFKKFAEDRGFELVKMHNLPLDPFYNSMVSASYKKSLTLLPVTVFYGFLSLLLGVFSIKRASSVIYVLKKK
mgnify:CR=1 FL=1